MLHPHEVNDVPMVVIYDGTDAFADMAIDNCDMLRMSKSQTLAFGFTIRTFIVGQPFRMRHFRRVL